MGKWTIPTLHDHLASQLCSVDRRHSELAEARDKAVDIALQAAKEKAQAHNELLTAMKEQQARFADKAETDRRLQMLEDAQSAAANKSIGIGQLWGTATAIVAAVGIIIAIIFNFAP